MKVTPRGGKGKSSNDPVKFLPVMPTKRSKPAWQTNPPAFLLSGKPGEDHDKNGIDLIAELTASMSLHKCIVSLLTLLFRCS